MKIIKPSVSLEWITPNAIEVIERAGRTSYKSEDLITPESGPVFVEKLNRLGHHSVLEHAVASVRIICDRGVMAEITRHRIASFTVESTRYCNYTKDKFGNEIQVIKPDDIPEPCLESLMTRGECRCDPCTIHFFWMDAVISAQDSYNVMIQKKITPQIARSVLPTCLKTELVMTANLREWIHFLKLRTDKASHPQMRQVANMVQAVLHKECPSIFVESK
jgi:thymidylate synthase (FAD)